MILPDSYVNTLINLDITQAQLLFLILAHKNRTDLAIKYKKTFPIEDQSMIGKYYIDDLIKKELLVKVGDRIEIGEKFKAIYMDKHGAADDIYEMYPAVYKENNKLIYLTLMDRNAFASLYEMFIQGSYAEHIEILKDLAYGIKNNMVTMKLEDFLKSKYWLTLRKQRLQYNLLDVQSIYNSEPVIDAKTE